MSTLFHAAICDDEPEMLAYLTSVLTEEANRIGLPLEMQSFLSANELLDAHQSEPFQILFLDIAMPEMDGFRLAEQLQQKTPEVFLLFITSQEQLVFQSLDYRPFQFVRKGTPECMQREVAASLIKIKRHIAQIKQLVLSLTFGTQRIIFARDIIYISSDKHYLDYHLINGETLRTREKIAEAEQTLSTCDLIRIHRSYIVNLRCVVQVDRQKGTVRLRGGTELELSRTYEKAMEEQYTQYLRTLL